MAFRRSRHGAQGVKAEPLRILYISVFAEADGVGGGIASHIELLRGMACAQGHQPHLLVASPRADRSVLAEKHVSYVGPTVGGAMPLRYEWNLIRAYRRLRRELRPDVVHVHSVSGIVVPMTEADIPVVVTLHAMPLCSGMVAGSERGGPLGRLRASVEASYWRQRMLAVRRYADHVFVVSEKTREDVQRLCLDAWEEGDCEVLMPGVDTSRFGELSREEARAGLGWGNEFVLLYAGRLTVAKQPEWLIDAVRALASECPGIKAVLVGACERAKWLRRRAEELGVADRVEFVGAVRHAAMPVYYAAADLFVNPTRENEASGLATAEAMASGLPVAISAEGADSGVVAGAGAMVFRDADELVARIRERLSNPEEAARLGQVGRACAARYSFDRTWARLDALYGKLRADVHPRSCCARSELAAVLCTGVVHAGLSRIRAAYGRIRRSTEGGLV